MAEAAERLRAGETVAIPTETVYGLAADALNQEAVARIFAAKGRPATNPLIVHVLDAQMARRFAQGWDARAEALASAFWPGPLTLVLEKSESVPDIVTAGGQTVAVRAPSHPVARAIIAAFDGPIAAPSANRSTGISPTTAEAVMDELGDRIELIVEGGPCAVGLESTVVDLSVAVPVVLRPGHVRRDQIEAVLGAPVAMSAADVEPGRTHKSPGLMRRHYAPKTPVRLLPPAELWTSASKHAVYLTHTVDIPPGRVGLRLPEAPRDYARELYGALRWADQQGAEELRLEAPPDTEVWAAVRDRLSRAATPPDR